MGASYKEYVLHDLCNVLLLCFLHLSESLAIYTEEVNLQISLVQNF